MTVRRLKTYAGGQGFVYQYYFVGKRRAAPQGSREGAAEYVFDVSQDRKSYFPVSIFLRDDAVAEWEASHGRDLTSSEQYAAVKLRLFRAFDEVENMEKRGRQLTLEGAQVEELLGGIGVE